MAVTKWNSVPDYDEWGKDSFWSCGDWVQWHKLLKEHFGSDKARYIWNYAYKQGTAFASHGNCRTFDSDFRAYASKNNLDIMEGTGFFAPILNIFGGALDFVDGIGDSISNIGQGIGKAGNVVKILIPVSLVGVGVYFGIRAYQNLRNPDLAMRRRAQNAELRRKKLETAVQAAKIAI